MKKYIVWALIAILAIVSLVVLNTISNRQATNIKIGYIAIGAGLPLFVAESNGYFAEEGLAVELIEFRSSNDIASAAIAGRIDVIGTGATNAMLDANTETGIGFQLFMANNYVKRADQQSTDFVLVAPGSDIDSFLDLRGKPVAVFPGSVGEVFADAVMPILGVSPDELEIVSMAPQQWMPSLKSGSVVAIAGAVEPFASQILADGEGLVLVDGYYAELMPSVPASGAWFVSGKLDRDEEEAIYRAFEKSIDYIEAEPIRAKRSLLSYTNIDPEILEQIRLQDWTLSREDDTRDSATEFAKLFFQSGGLQREPIDDDWIWK